MNNYFQKFYSKSFYIAILSVSILILVFLLPGQVWSQKKQLTSSDKVVKAALIDHPRIRKDFKEFALAKEKQAKVYKDEKKWYEQALQLLDKQTKEQLKQDSLENGKAHEQILLQADSRRSELMNNYQASQKRINQERLSITKEYEDKINTAIAVVVSEGGFTEVKPLTKDSSNKRSADITDLILKKLN